MAKKKGKTAAPPLDMTVGRLRVRDHAAVAGDPDSCLSGTDAVFEPGDLLVEEIDDAREWHGGVIVRAADRAELARLIAGGP